MKLGNETDIKVVLSMPLGAAVSLLENYTRSSVGLLWKTILLEVSSEDDIKSVSIESFSKGSTAYIGIILAYTKPDGTECTRRFELRDGKWIDSRYGDGDSNHGLYFTKPEE